MNITYEMIVGLIVNVTGLLLTASTITYRIKILEKKVEENSNRMERLTVAEESIKTLNYRLDGIERRLNS